MNRIKHTITKYTTVDARTVPVAFPRVVGGGVVASGGAESPLDRHAVADRGRLVMPAGVMRRDRRRLGPDRLDGQDAPALLGELGARLRVRVEEREVGDDDGDGQRDRQYAGERAQRPDEHADVRLGRHVAVADRRHRHDRPPQPHLAPDHTTHTPSSLPAAHNSHVASRAVQWCIGGYTRVYAVYTNLRGFLTAYTHLSDHK